MAEKWKRVDGYPDYLVSNEGRVMSLKGADPKFLKPSKGEGRYYQVQLLKDGKSTTKRIHRLVAEAFLCNPEGKPQIDHINGDKLDNRAENLRWATSEENNNNPITLPQRIIAQHQYWEANRTEGTKRRWRKLYPGESVSDDGVYHFST